MTSHPIRPKPSEAWNSSEVVNVCDYHRTNIERQKQARSIARNGRANVPKKTIQKAVTCEDTRDVKRLNCLAQTRLDICMYDICIYYVYIYIYMYTAGPIHQGVLINVVFQLAAIRCIHR